MITLMYLCLQKKKGRKDDDDSDSEATSRLFSYKNKNPKPANCILPLVSILPTVTATLVPITNGTFLSRYPTPCDIPTKQNGFPSPLINYGRMKCLSQHGGLTLYHYILKFSDTPLLKGKHTPKNISPEHDIGIMWKKWSDVVYANERL